jgi:hypothetical protein
VADHFDAQGLIVPSVQDILDDIGADQRANIDPLLATDADSIVGSGNGIFASQDRELWECLQLLAASFDPDQAEGSSLDAVCALTGTERTPAYPSRFKGSRKLSVTLDPAGVVTSGVSKFGIPGTTIQFVATETVTNGTALQAVFLVAAECTVNGPTHANAGTVTAIVTPGPGIVAVTNVHDVILGADTESDESLRQRRELELRQSGSGTKDAIIADILAIENDDGSKPVRSAQIIENNTDATVNGVPPHSYQLIVWDGPGMDADDDDVTAVVFANHVPGINAFAVRPTQRTLTISITLRYTTAYVGDAAVKQALADYISLELEPNAGGTTGTVRFSKLIAVAMGLAGVDEISSITLQLSSDPPVVLADVQPALREIAVTDTSLISVTSSVA